MSLRRIVLFLLTIVILGLVALLAAPFLPAITWAIALAIVTNRPHRWLQRKLHRPSLVAALGVLLVVVIIVVPIVFLVQNLGGQLYSAVKAVQSGSVQDQVAGLLVKYPRLNYWVDQASTQINFRQATQQIAQFASSWLASLLSGSVTAITQLFIMLFTLFFLYQDQAEAMATLRSLLPLREQEIDRLLQRIEDTTKATLQGSLTVAAIQGCLGGLMFWILGVPGALVWAIVMALLATIPSLGTFLVWAPVALYLGLSGHWTKAAVLTAWGVFVIGTVDNLLYPKLVGSRMQLHTVPVFFAVLGGIGIFGITGIILGPVLLAVAVTLLRFWRERESAAEGPMIVER